MAQMRQILIGGTLATATALGLYSWLAPNPFAPPPSPPESAAPVEPGLTLRNATLEQPDENGVMMWRVRGEEVTYSPNRDVATILRPDGEIFQDGEIVYNITADTGQILDNGNVIVLQGNIVATGINSGSVLRGNELVWQADADVLTVRGSVTGSHPQITASADEARVINAENRIELIGNVVAHTVVEDPKTEPRLKLQAQQIQWLWEEEQLVSPTALRVEQLQDQTITDVLLGDQGVVRLDDQVATLQGNVAMQMLGFPLNAASSLMEWQVADQVVTMPQPLTVVHPTEQMQVTARQGRIDLENQVVTLQQDVVAVGQRNQSRLTSNQLIWTVPDQIVVAEGNVNYQQADPAMNLTGSRGIGRLNESIFRVEGQQVVTEIVPN